MDPSVVSYITSAATANMGAALYYQMKVRDYIPEVSVAINDEPSKNIHIVGRTHFSGNFIKAKTSETAYALFEILTGAKVRSLHVSGISDTTSTKLAVFSLE
jgi:hypothetical protein